MQNSFHRVHKLCCFLQPKAYYKCFTAALEPTLPILFSTYLFPQVFLLLSKLGNFRVDIFFSLYYNSEAYQQESDNNLKLVESVPGLFL